MLDAGDRAALAVRRRVHDPSILVNDIQSAARDFNGEQNLFATPMADSVVGEFKRGFGVGMNNGELAFDAASTLVGGAALRGAAGLGSVAKAATAKELEFLAANPGFAARLELPYEGMGHHIVGRRTRLPAVLGGGRIPEFILENRFNKIRTEGMSTRDFYRNHVGVDRYYHGGKVGKAYGDVRWSAARDLGWTDYGPLGRLDYGTSPYTKAVAGSILLGGTSADSADRRAGK